MQLRVYFALNCSMRSPNRIADACMRDGYCTAELIVWYVMKQLILPPDINEVTMQKEILTHPKVAPSTLDQGCALGAQNLYTNTARRGPQQPP